MRKSHGQEFSNIAASATIMPKEALQKVSSHKKEISLGVPKEYYNQERRLTLTPTAVKHLSALGFQIIIEEGAGNFSRFTDHEYSEAGALVTKERKKIFEANIVCKINFPTTEEINLMPGKQLLFSSLNLDLLDKERLELLSKKKMNAFCLQYMQDESLGYPVIQSMSEIVGRAAIFIASEYLTSDHGMGQILGGITGISPSEIVIIGAGTVGYYSTKTALALGSCVKIFDDSIYRLRRFQNDLGHPVYNSTLRPETLFKEIKQADVVIGALRARNGRAPVVVSEDMVMQMKEGAVIIDVSIDQGGCIETSEMTSLEKPTFTKHGVIHYCVPNIASRVPRTASIALSNILSPVFEDLATCGSLDNYLWERPFVRSGLYMYKGILTNYHLGNRFNINGKSIDLLLTSNL